MNDILIFAGTTEGRALSQRLCRNRIRHLLCVATEYGEQVLTDSSYAIVRKGRLNAEEMTRLMEEEKVKTVVDATHPYAAEVTENIRQAAKAAGVRYLRLDRYRADGTESDGQKGPPGAIRYFSDPAHCAAALKETEGNILLTTGSKDLPLFCADPKLRERLVARVLPGAESIGLCEAAGIPGKRIIAMQGPFSEEMNLAQLHDFEISVLVTKNSGKAGGFAAKCEAAAKAGARVFVIERPEADDGFSFEEICRRLDLPAEEAKETGCVSLIGCGMGNRRSMTVEAAEALAEADIVFGAKRLLEDCRVTQRAYPVYLAKDILPVLREAFADTAAVPAKKAAILFSGDTGFYSGASKLTAALQEEISAGRLRAALRIYPGISSLSALAAKAALSWEDAKILSVHGKGSVEEWSASVLDAAAHHAKTFLLLSGLSDLKEIGALLCRHGLSECKMHIGYRMGADAERVFEISPEECAALTEEGLYSVFIRNPHPESPAATCGLPDTAFLRDRVPMTKAEIRAVGLSKLGLKRDSVLFDVGSGTGSIAVEAARLSPDLRVYAIERKDEAVALLHRNIEKFGLYNIQVVPAYAPEGLADLPAPTHAFLGGTGGKMKEILQELMKMTDKIRIVATAVSFETLQELLQVKENPAAADYEIVSVAATRSRLLGHYNMLQAENPVWIASWTMQR